MLQKGNSLIGFPEARRAPDGKLQSFQPGIGMLVSAQDAPVVPVWIRGTYEALPPGRRWPRRGGVSITIGPAVMPRTLAKETSEGSAYKRIAKALRGRVAQLGKAESQ